MPSAKNFLGLLEKLQSADITVHQNRCAVVRNRNATCMKCAEVCTSGCISYNDNELIVSPEKCIGCGTCATVCPTCALEAHRPNDAELLAHLRALMRRQGEVIFEKLDAGDLSLNLESYDLTCGQKTIHLSFKEFSLAKVLMSNPGQVVSKELLIERVWGVESSAEDNNVEAYISFLRKKMRFLGSQACIETIRKAGYRFAADGAAA